MVLRSVAARPAKAVPLALAATVALGVAMAVALEVYDQALGVWAFDALLEHVGGHGGHGGGRPLWTRDDVVVPGALLFEVASAGGLAWLITRRVGVTGLGVGLAIALAGATWRLREREERVAEERRQQAEADAAAPAVAPPPPAPEDPLSPEAEGLLRKLRETPP
ncbi:MAG: hypothetical protein HY901_15690 [Deltaproteobacteria bacterium]|nr:hypothetical protein [Deltaproteobacteria bacterium]